jgi:hypothetical protein
MDSITEKLERIPYFYLVIACSILFAFYVSSFYVISRLIGSKQNWIAVKDQIKMIWSFTLPASVLLFLAALLYFRINRENAVYFICVMAFLSFGLSYGALAVATIHKE